MNASLQRPYHVVFFWIPARNEQKRFDGVSIQRSFRKGWTKRATIIYGCT